jgi:ATP-dependent DNA helicase RecQ
MTDPNAAVLHTYYPDICSFRVGQETAINRVVSGHNTLCLMPTGSGKSLVYEVAGIRRGGITLVLSPLIALMSQQARRLEKRGLGALSLSDLEGPKMYDSLRKLAPRRQPQFLFSSPERLSFDGFLEFALAKARNDIGLIVIDEAHCVSQWGHTFRPAYKAIPKCLNDIFGPQGWPPILSLTATLNRRDCDEVCHDFRIAEAGVVRTPSQLRDNLSLCCEHHEDEKAKKARLGEILAQHRDEKVIVYVHRKEGEYGTELLAAHFQAEGYSCDFFDADRMKSEKEDVLAMFEGGQTRVVFATSAFGMGIDIPDVRVVVHYLLPESIEQYYQEVGRAGRDGKPAFGYLLYSDTNPKVRRDLIRRSSVSRSQIETMFRKKLALRESETVRSIDPYRDIVEGLGERTAWHLLELAGVVQVVAKGPAILKCFYPSSKGATGVLERYLAASGIGSTKAVARKLGVSVRTVLQDVFAEYAAGHAKLESWPSQACFFTTPREMPVEEVEAIEKDLERKLEARISGFEALVHMVRSGCDPTAQVRSHLGLTDTESLG